MSAESQVVITGLGVVSPIGVGRDAFARALRAGTSGVSPLAELADTAFRVKFGAAVTDFEPKEFVRPRKSLKVMSREIQMGLAAATLAMSDAGDPQPDPDRFGVVFGSEMLYCPVDELSDVFRACLVDGQFDFSKWGHAATHGLYPLWMLKYLPNMTACHIGIAHDSRGPNNTITLGEASSLLALSEAVSVIQRGHADIMITGGSGSRLSLTPFLFRDEADFSHRSDAPREASRPFDLQRDGMVNGEGAAAFVLETAAHAAARGAQPLATVEAVHCTFANPSAISVSLRRSMEALLARADLAADQVSHVNANGLSTIQDDRFEAEAIASLLGPVPVTALKSYFGNLGAGTAAVELAASVIGMHEHWLPPTLNYHTPDPACPIRVIQDDILRQPQNYAIKLARSGTGQIASLLLGRGSRQASTS